MGRVAEAEQLDWKGLIWTLVRTDFKVRYHRTILGFLWALARPVAMLITLLVVFGALFHSQPDFSLKLVVGLFLWEYFNEATKVGLIALHMKGYLLTKTRFPRWVLVLTSQSNPLITLAVYAVTMLVVLLVTGKALPPLHLLLFLFYVLQLLIICLGISLAGSVLFLRFRDLNQVWEVVTASGFFITPIVYPIEVLPHELHFWLYLWPPTPVIQFARSVLIEGTVPSLRAHLLLFGMSMGIFLIGATLFRTFQARAAEQL
jgi:ABC-type polysaccharide/polyol phosphate export permease